MANLSELNAIPVSVKGESPIPFEEGRDKQDDPLSVMVGFELLVEWARLLAARTRCHYFCSERHTEALLSLGESKARLNECGRWRESDSFSAREKAALNLSERLSQTNVRMSEDVLKNARHYLTEDEVVYLSSAALSVNDWIDLQSGPPVKVLVVEDNPHDQELLRRQLSKIHIAEQVTFVSDARQALQILTGERGKLCRNELVAIFLDIHLPGMNGIELLAQIRLMPEMEEFPVIIMTSSNSPEDMEKCKELKVADYVQKPVTFTSFSHAIANIFHS